MQLSSFLADSIRKLLVPLAPERVIVFGSYATGNPTPDSDLDIYVVTADEGVPETYDDLRKIQRSVLRVLRPLLSDIALDVIVHTRGMHKRFLAAGSSFSREIERTGISVI